MKDIIATILILWSVSAFSQGYTSQSVLADGDIYKISSDRAGIYKLSYSFLSDALNISLESVDPRNIRLFGNGNSMLPENIDEERIDDLKEIQIHVSGEEDGRFDVQDYILFYGQPADKRIWDSSRNIFSVETNIYSDRVYYFLKIGDAPGQRIQTIEETGSPEYVSTGFDAFLKYEKEEINLLNDFVSTSGTGQNWYGDLFKGIRQRDYSDKFIFPNLISSDAGHVKVVFASRSDATTALKVKIEGQEFSRLIGSVDLSDPEGRYARIGIIEESFNAQGDNLNIQLDFPQINGNSTGWLDLIEVNARRAIRYENQPLIFSDHHTQQFATSQIIIETLNPQLKVWDISNPLQPISIITNHTQNRTSFNASTSLLRTFIAFNEDQSLTPVALGQLPNQNLHGLDGINMLIVHPSNLEEQAQQLANHRMLHSGISVETIRIEEIFNEFASGSPDVTAIRDFAKMLYDRNEGFKYLLLFGDATFDFKNIAGLSPSLNLVPTYETRESLDPIRGFPTDDYFGLLTSGEGADLKGALDIAIGRLPAKNEQEAIVLVNKIINYDTNPGYQDSWLNQLTFS
ncbi:MAG: hypothetical protein KJP00_09875, partial [Bacteroidia bacterium]|nr:hypothetical protein [Bacteroidia bacterium]